MRVPSQSTRRSLSILTLLVSCLVSLAHPMPSVTAQTALAPCGVAEGFEFPVADIDTHTTDFGIYRARWGGLHTGIDIAFGQVGLPVRAAARGEVTFSDTEGWDTEKGVVVIQHTLADGSVVNTLYGHMEELGNITFPVRGQCIEQGDIIGTVGSPLQSRPHLHYEIRMRYRHEGGPGYTDSNPLDLGWLHPVDFTFLSRVIVLPAYRDHFLLTEKPVLPPLLMPDGGVITAHSRQIIGRNAEGGVEWQFDILANATGLHALGDGRVLISLFGGQILVLNRGSASALWQAPTSTLPPVVLPGDRVVLATSSSTLTAYTPDGMLLWQTPPFPAAIARIAISGDLIALATGDGQVWIVDSQGILLFQQAFPSVSIIAPAPDSGFTLLDGSTISSIDRALNHRIIVNTDRPITTGATLLDTGETVYLYTGEGRALYAYDRAGTLRWIAYMPGSHSRPPLLSVGGGQRLYVLTEDGQLLVYAVENGRLLEQIALYDGGADGLSAARWLNVDAEDTVRFSSGYLSVVTLDGLALGDAAP